jgi:chromosome segregation ATPase
MISITRGILRLGLIGGLVLGGATLLLGPERVACGLGIVRVKAQSMVDQVVNNDDPAAMRRHLENLADEYPDRIAEVQGELAEIEHQLGQFDRDIDVSQRVVALTSEDLGQMKALVVRAQAANKGGTRRVSIRFEGTRFDLDEAYAEARRINQVRVTYQDRLASDEQQMEFLREQKARMTEILNKLEEDFTTYQAQLWQLDREIDAIERNERLIALTEQQQYTLSSFDRYGNVKSLSQIQGKLAELRAVQEAQLQSLAKKGVRHDYHRQAEHELQLGATGHIPTDFLNPFDEIEINSIDLEIDESDVVTDDNIAWAGPTILPKR